MSDSILNSVKKILGLGEDYTSFDEDVILNINSTFSTLNQLGVGPEDGFAISDDTATWVDFLGDDARLNHVKTYVWLRVRLLFDPPSTSYSLESMKHQVQELEWRLNVQREEMTWNSP